jgi:hypothetical protein
MERTLTVKTEPWLQEILTALAALAALASDQGVMTEDEARDWAYASAETFTRRGVRVEWAERKAAGCDEVGE